MAGGTEAEPSAWELSEAKTPPHPHSDERKSDIWRREFTFVVSLFLYLSFSRAEDTKKAATVKRGDGADESVVYTHTRSDETP